jgi:hypothetical protein
MKKNDKKIEKAIVEILTAVCNTAQHNYDGFTWLTHVVNYSHFPDSLYVICIFDTNEQLQQSDLKGLRKFIKQQLLSINITIKDLSRQIHFDTEENCNNKHNGNWDQYFNSLPLKGS